jgi:hypothetical protein
MSKYFTYFPTVKNDLKNSGNFIDVTNILRRFKFRSSVQDITGIFYNYDIQSGDRPDTISEKYYDSPSHAWIILYFNNITDPFFGWPLFGNTFEEYVKGKYGSIATAQSTVHEYRWILKDKEIKFDETVINERYIVVDQTTYNTLSPTIRRLVTKYDFEEEENERKRKIKILDSRYLQKVLSEAEEILKNGV